MLCLGGMQRATPSSGKAEGKGGGTRWGRAGGEKSGTTGFKMTPVCVSQCKPLATHSSNDGNYEYESRGCIQACTKKPTPEQLFETPRCQTRHASTSTPLRGTNARGRRPQSGGTPLLMRSTCTGCLTPRMR